jgi:hypothetical protein
MSAKDVGVALKAKACCSSNNRSSHSDSITIRNFSLTGHHVSGQVVVSQTSCAARATTFDE